MFPNTSQWRADFFRGAVAEPMRPQQEGAQAMTIDDPTANDDGDSIPLYDGPPTHAQIIAANPAQSNGETNSPVRHRRQASRKPAENVEVCLSAHDASGRTDHCECPLLDISAGGAAVLFDRVIVPGSRCYVSYRSISRQPIHVGGTARSCERLGPKCFRIGIKFDRALSIDEQRAAKRRIGKAVSPIHKARRFRALGDDPPATAYRDSQYAKPLVIAPRSTDDRAAPYDLTQD
jgi:hypothetical protein